MILRAKDRLVLFWHEDFAFADVVCARDDAFVFHLFDKLCGFVVADRELALDVGCGALAIFDDDGDGCIVKRVFAVGVAAEAEDGVDIACVVVGWALDNT